jgi:hypothetical protein
MEIGFLHPPLMKLELMPRQKDVYEKTHPETLAEVIQSVTMEVKQSEVEQLCQPVQKEGCWTGDRDQGKEEDCQRKVGIYYVQRNK